MGGCCRRPSSTAPVAYSLLSLVHSLLSKFEPCKSENRVPQPLAPLCGSQTVRHSPYEIKNERLFLDVSIRNRLSFFISHGSKLIRTLQQDPFLKQFCLEDMYSCSSDYLWYPYYPEYHDYCYQNVISRDNTGLSPADNIYWLGCIIASEGRNLNNRFDPNERLNWDLSLQTGILRYAKPRRRLFRKRLKQQ